MMRVSKDAISCIVSSCVIFRQQVYARRDPVGLRVVLLEDCGRCFGVEWLGVFFAMLVGLLAMPLFLTR